MLPEPDEYRPVVMSANVNEGAAAEPLAKFNEVIELSVPELAL
jgi:hypothetical protein